MTSDPAVVVDGLTPDNTGATAAVPLTVIVAGAVVCPAAVTVTVAWPGSIGHG